MPPTDDEVMDRAISISVYEMLAEPLPPEALKIDNGRGFPLTSITAGFVLERLNQTFGLLGYGWRYVHGPFHIEGAKDEILVEVALQWRMTCDATNPCYSHPIYWGQQVHAESGQLSEGWYLNKDMPAVWSEPVFATGGAATNRKGGIPMTDAHRAALTNGITKAAARLGVGIDVWKGENDAPPDTGTGKTARKKRTQPSSVRILAGAPRSLEEIQAAAQAEFDKLARVDGDAETKDLQPLAVQMSKLGLRMQAIRLIQLLLGEGKVTRRRVMAAYNFTLKATESDVAVLNLAAKDRWDLPQQTS